MAASKLPSAKLRRAPGWLGVPDDVNALLPGLWSAGVDKDVDGVLTAAEAHLSGLVSRLVEDEELRATAEMVAAEIADGPVRAMVRTRALVRKAATRTLEGQLDDEAQLIAESASDAEGREGVRAFVEKRAPDFRNAR